MLLNLHIICHDLGKQIVGSRIEDKPTVRTLRTAKLYESKTPLDKQMLFIGKPTSFECISKATLDAPLNIICLGEPSETLLNSHANIAWVSPDVAPTDLLMRVFDVFELYNDVHRAILEDAIREKPLRSIAKRAADLFGKPIYIWDSHNQVVLSYIDEKRYDLPSDYEKHIEGSMLAPIEIDAWNEALANQGVSQEVLTTHEPYYLFNPEIFNYGAINSNLFVGGKRVATLTVDEVGEAFDERDYALVDSFASLFSSFIQRDKDINLSATAHLNRLLENLLGRKSVQHAELRSALHRIGWSVNDPLICIAATPKHPPYSDRTLRAISNMVCSKCENAVYATFEGAIAFVLNLGKTAQPSRQFATSFANTVTSLRYKVNLGCSTVFANMGDLHDYFRQAEIAIMISEDMDAGNQDIVFYDDYILEGIVLNIREHSTPEIVCPTGLMNLIQYDNANKTCYTAILDEYLNCNMSTSETARRLFMHRNTLLTRLAKMRSLLDMNLDNPENRLLIMFALRAMRSTKLLRRVLENKALDSMP